MWVTDARAPSPPSSPQLGEVDLDVVLLARIAGVTHIRLVATSATMLNITADASSPSLGIGVQADRLRARVVVSHEVHAPPGWRAAARRATPRAGRVGRGCPRRAPARSPPAPGRGSGWCGRRLVVDAMFRPVVSTTRLVAREREHVPVAPRRARSWRPPDRVGTVASLERAPRDQHTGDAHASSQAFSDPMPWPPPCAFIPTAGRQHTTVGDATARGRPLGRRPPPRRCPGRRRANARCGRAAWCRSVTDTLEQRSGGGGLGGWLRGGRAPVPVGWRHVPLLALEEEQLALGGLEQGFEFLERVDREQLEDGHRGADRHALQHVHGLGIGGLRRHEVRRQQVLQLFGRDTAPVEVAVIEADRALVSRELLADCMPRSCRPRVRARPAARSSTPLRSPVRSLARSLVRSLARYEGTGSGGSHPGGCLVPRASCAARRRARRTNPVAPDRPPPCPPGATAPRPPSPRRPKARGPRPVRRRCGPRRAAPPREGPPPDGDARSRRPWRRRWPPHRVPSTTSTSCIDSEPSSGTPCGRSPGMPGRCWCSVPPNATFSYCIPRQMHRVGRPVRTASRTRSISNASRSGSTPYTRSPGVTPYRAELTSPPPTSRSASKGATFSAGHRRAPLARRSRCARRPPSCGPRTAPARRSPLGPPRHAVVRQVVGGHRDERPTPSVTTALAPPSANAGTSRRP